MIILQDVSEGIVKLWKPRINAKKFIIFIEDLKRNPYKYLDSTNANNAPIVTPEESINDAEIETDISKDPDKVDIESQYQTIPIRRKEETTSTMSTVEELIRRLVPAKSFLYRHQQKAERTPSYLPMDAGAPKKRKLFRLSSYEYPFFDIKARFSKTESSNDRGYYSMKRNSRYYIARTCKKADTKPKYKSLSTPEELTEKYPEDHFYEDLCYNEVEKVNEKPVETRVVSVKPCIVKIQELFQSFKVPFFKRHEMIEEKKVESAESVESEKETNLYENSDSIVNMYDSVRVNRPVTEESQANKVSLVFVLLIIIILMIYFSLFIKIQYFY